MDEYWRLMGEIARCPIVTEIQSGASNSAHPCFAIVSAQQGRSFQVPEPWSGRLDTAPVLFVSSNPSIDDSEKYPDQSWNLNQTKDFFHNRFSAKAPWVKRGLYTLQRDGSYSSDWVRFWAAARSRACEILDKKKNEIRPGEDFALTEVAHCKSREEEGVAKARDFCSDRYLSRILSASAARVLVVFGEPAKKAVSGRLSAEMRPLINQERLAWIGNRKLVAFLPHPNERGSKKSCKDNLGAEGLSLIRSQFKS